MLSEYKEPPEVALTKPVPKEERVVEPLDATCRKVAPEEDATLKTSKVGLVEVPCTTRVALGEVEAILNWLEK